MTWSLAELSESGETLIDELHIVGMYVETEKHQTSCGDTTDAVKELESLKNEIEVGLAVALRPEIILKWKERGDISITAVSDFGLCIQSTQHTCSIAYKPSHKLLIVAAGKR